MSSTRWDGLSKRKAVRKTPQFRRQRTTQDYSFDRYGNKTATASGGYTANNQTIPLDGLPSQGFDDATNRITDSGYSYDKAGNVTRGKAPNGSWQNYEYDTAGRLRYVKDDTNWIQQSNEYASSRERLASWSYASVDITYYAWGGSSVLAEYSTQSGSSSLTWQKSSVYAGSRLLSTITNTSGNEVTEYHHPDRLGTRLISNPTTATQDEQLTLPFGTLIGAETSATNDKRFTSYDRSGIAGGLDYAVNRNYNSGQSRFTQVDPIGMASASIGDPQSLNLFAYVQNNPIDFVDPSGLDEEIIIIDAEPAYHDWSSFYQFLLHSLEFSRRGRGGGGGGDGPEIGAGVPGNIRNIVKQIAERPRCAAALEKIAQKLDKLFGKRRKTEEGKTFIETVFDSIKKIKIDKNKTGRSTFDVKNIRLEESDNQEAGKAFIDSAFGNSVLQELVHAFRKSGKYDDGNLIKAGQDIIKSKDLDKETMDFLDKILVNKKGAHEIVTAACAYSNRDLQALQNAGRSLGENK